MKNSVVLPCIMLIIAFTMASETAAQTFGIRAGLNLSNMLIKDDHYTSSDHFKMNPGFHLGATAEIPIPNKMISFETGCLLSAKGYKLSFNEGQFEVKGKLDLLYFDIPLNAKASFDLGGAKIYGVFGPYLGIGLSGKWKSELTYDGDYNLYERDIKWGSDEDRDDLKRFDFGLTAGTGVGINAFNIGLSYGLGLANISPDTEGSTKQKNRLLSVSLGYRFSRN